LLTTRWPALLAAAVLPSLSSSLAGFVFRVTYFSGLPYLSAQTIRSNYPLKLSLKISTYRLIDTSSS
jgi:hypothetical protein